MFQIPSGMVVTIDVLVEAADRIRQHLNGKKFKLVEVDDEGNEITNHGTMSLKECKINLLRGSITIIPDIHIPAHVLWINDSANYVVLSFLADQLKITDENNRKFEYRFVKR